MMFSFNSTILDVACGMSYYEGLNDICIRLYIISVTHLHNSVFKRFFILVFL